jgi:hypothetical protein
LTQRVEAAEHLELKVVELSGAGEAERRWRKTWTRCRESDFRKIPGARLVLIIKNLIDYCSKCPWRALMLGAI